MAEALSGLHRSRIHRALSRPNLLLGADRELVLLENLRNLDKVGYRPFCMAALPISLEDQDGGPARVMAVLEK